MILVTRVTCLSVSSVAFEHVLVGETPDESDNTNSFKYWTVVPSCSNVLNITKETFVGGNF